MFVALLFAYNFAAGERMQVNDGLGWDGLQYAQFTWTPTRELLFKWPSYYVGRFLPPIAIHNVAELLNIDISTPRRMIAAYYVVNTLVLCLAFLMLLRISKLAGWSPPATLVAVASIFFNYGVLKQVNYGPMSTDIMALGCAVATLYAWVGRSFYSLIVVTIVSAFVWPSLIYLQLPLLVFWNVSGIALDAPPPRFPWGRIAAAVIAAGTVAVALLLYLFTDFRLTIRTNPVNDRLLWLSAPLLAGFIYFGINRFTDPFYYLRAARFVRWQNVVIALAIFVGVQLVVRYFSNGGVGPLNPLQYIGLIGQAGLVNPLVSLIAHAQFYGPIVPFALLCWPRVQAGVLAAGPGMASIFALSVYLAIGTESRQDLPFLPLLAFFVVNELDRLSVDWFTAWCFTGMALAVSKFWLTINVAPWTGDFLEFPDQMLFMNHGPWMSNQMYIVFVAVFLLMMIAAAALLRALGQRRCDVTDPTGVPVTR